MADIEFEYKLTNGDGSKAEPVTGKITFPEGTSCPEVTAEITRRLSIICKAFFTTDVEIER